MPKALRIRIRNIGIIADTEFECNQPLLIFYGDIKAGKTTILRAVRWLFGGAFPQDIIRHGATEAHVSMDVDNGSITREWYRGADNVTQSRPIVFVRDGKPVKRPVDEIAKLLNPFLLDQDFLIRKGEADRKAYFVELLGVDTNELDAEATAIDAQASDLRATIRAYGDIDLTPVAKPDVTALRDQLKTIRAQHASNVAAWNAEIVAMDHAHRRESIKISGENQIISQHNGGVDRATMRLEQENRNIVLTHQAIARLQAQLESQLKEASSIEDWLKDNPKRPEQPLPTAPDTSVLHGKISNTPDTTEIEQKISEAAAGEVRWAAYLANVDRAERRDQDAKTLRGLEARQRAIKGERAAKLKGSADTCGIPDLQFDPSGNIVFEQTTMGMLSTSQLMKLSSLISDKFPSGLGIELLDKAESLGKSIFTFIDRARREEKTILATVVGERPATVPEHVGVFVVDHGTVTHVTSPPVTNGTSTIRDDVTTIRDVTNGTKTGTQGEML